MSGVNMEKEWIKLPKAILCLASTIDYNMSLSAFTSISNSPSRADSHTLYITRTAVTFIFGPKNSKKADRWHLFRRTRFWDEDQLHEQLSICNL